MKDYALRVVVEMSKYLPNVSVINGVDFLHVSTFADGEMEVDVNSSIRGKKVVLFASCSRNEADKANDKSVADYKMELYFAIDALKRSQAKTIIVFEPFVSCSRSDRTEGHSSVGIWVHFKILASLGTQHIVTYQLHSDKSKSILDPAVCAIDDVPAMNLLKKYVCDAYIRDCHNLENVVRNNWAFCSVDAGGEKLARDFANAFGAHLVVAHKQRDYSKSNTIKSINILSAEPVEGKVLWIVDDMIDTGSSEESLINALIPLKPAEINIIAIHAILSEPAPEKLRAFFEKGILKRIIVTDTVYCSNFMPEGIPGLEVVSSVAMSAKVINAIVTNSSMRKLFYIFDAGTYLGSQSSLFDKTWTAPVA
jgi:ribose-phosphate pyrophosphokinase